MADGDLCDPILMQRQELWDTRLVSEYCLIVWETPSLPSGSAVKNPPAAQEPQELQIQSPAEGVACHSSIHAWKIPWTEEPGQLQSLGSQSRT